MKLTERVLAHLATKREKVTATKIDVTRTILAQDRENWEHVRNSRLYKNRPTEHCQLLECIEVERMKALEIAKRIIMKAQVDEDLAWLEDNSFILDGEYAQLVPDQDDAIFIDMVDDAIITLIRKAEKL